MGESTPSVNSPSAGSVASGSAFYLAAWESDDPEVVRERLGRISRTAEELIDVLKDESTS